MGDLLGGICTYLPLDGAKLPPGGDLRGECTCFLCCTFLLATIIFGGDNALDAFYLAIVGGIAWEVI